MNNLCGPVFTEIRKLNPTARNFKFSQQNYLAASSLKSNKPSQDLSLVDQLFETPLRSEKAKLALLEAKMPA